MARVYLEITVSPRAEDLGRRFDLEPGTWRVIGRALSTQETVPLTRRGDRALDADRQGMVDRAVGDDPAQARRNARRASDVDLLDENASRTHAMVFCDAQGAVAVVDLMSTNGTRVNDEPVQDADLSEGDVIGVGGTLLRLVSRR